MLVNGYASYRPCQLQSVGITTGSIKGCVGKEPRVDKLPKWGWDRRDTATLAELIVSCLCNVCVCVCVCVCVWVGLVAPG